jgi:hypothetical protein
MNKKTIWTLVGIAAVATVVILVVRKNKKDKEQKSNAAGKLVKGGAGTQRWNQPNPDGTCPAGFWKGSDGMCYPSTKATK